VGDHQFWQIFNETWTPLFFIVQCYCNTTARLYDYADDAQDEKKNILKRNIGLFRDFVNAKETIMASISPSYKIDWLF
jgi:hypothetical protein